MSLDPQLKDLLDKAKEALGNQKKIDEAINEIKAWGLEKGRLFEAEKAVKEIGEQIKKLDENVTKKLDQVRRQAIGDRNHYRGSLGSATNAIAFSLLLIANTCGRDNAEVRKKAMQMIDADFKEIGEHMKAVHENEQGLVPTEQSAYIHRLVESYGVFPANAMPMPMTSDVLNFNRRKTGFRAHKVKNRVAPAQQALGWASINLTADEYQILTSYPITLEEDALVSIAELIVQEMGLGFAITMDENAFVGDGTDAYDNEVGIVTLLTQINGVDDGGGLVRSSGANGTGWGGITRNDVSKLIGQARYVRPGMGKLICSNEFFWQVLAPLALAAGGVTRVETEDGPRLQFLGTRVQVLHAMPRTPGNSQVPLLYGDLYQSSTLGNRRNMQVRESREAFWTTREVGVMATARYAINHHSLGDANIPGPVVGLITPPAS